MPIQEPKVMDLVGQVEVLWAKRNAQGKAYSVKVQLRYKGDRYTLTFFTRRENGKEKIVRGEKFRNGIAFTESGQSVWVPAGVYGAMYRKAAAVLNEKFSQQELLPLRP